MNPNARRCGPVKAWGVYNFGSALRATFRTRQQAKAFVEQHTGDTWNTASAYMQIRRVIVTPAERKP